jgi:hypothetical protein
MNPPVEQIDSIPYDPARFCRDLRHAASAIAAPFDEAKVRRSLEVFDAELRRCVVQMKATCKAGSGVYYRFFYKWERDLTARAQQHGMIPAGHAPIIDLQAEVLDGCRGATRAGLDFDTGFGLAKVWTFTGGPTSLDEMLRLPSIPDSVCRHRDFLLRHGLRHVFFVASDFQQDSMNVYFGLDDDCRNEAWLRRLVEATGGGPSDPAVYASMLASLAVSAGVGTTFAWDRPEMGRWCLYGLNLPLEDAAATAQLPPLSPRLARFRAEAPTLNRSPQYNVAWSFGRAGYYTKLEKSYARDATYFLTVEMGGDLTHTTPLAEAPA